jgi:hypothetical protein
VDRLRFGNGFRTEAEAVAVIEEEVIPALDMAPGNDPFTR